MLALLPSVPAAWGANYYVDATTGNDSNPGTVARPWKTISRVNKAGLRPGDVVYFRRGDTLRATLNVPSSGRPGNPITFTAYPNDPAVPRPVISCTENITGKLWQGILGNGGFQADASKAACPRNIPGWTIRSTHGYFCTVDPESGRTNALRIVNQRGNTDIVSAPVRLEAGTAYTLEGRVRAANGGRVYLYLASSAPHLSYLVTDGRGNGRWAVAKRKSMRPFLATSSTSWVRFDIQFAGINASAVRLRASVRRSRGTAWLSDIMLLDGRRNYWTLSIGSHLVPRILLLNGLRISQSTGLNKAKRWYALGGTSKLVRYVPRTARPSGLVELGVRRTGILLHDKSYVTIENLVVNGCEGARENSLTQGAGILLSSGSSHNVIRNVVVKNSVEGIRVEGDGPQGQLNTGNVFANFVISNGVRQGIALRSYAAENLIRNCRIHDINMLPSDNVPEDKEAVSIGGTTGNGPGNIVEHCEIYNVGLSERAGMGIAVFNSPDTTIRGNYVHDIGAIGIGVGTNGKSPDEYRSDNIRIYNNVVARTGLSPLASPGQSIAVTVADDGAISGVRILNNTIVDCELNDSKGGGISIRGVANPNNTVNTISDVAIENNVIYGCKGAYPRAIFIGSKEIVAVKNLLSDYNLFYSPPGTMAHRSFISYEGADYTAGEFAEYQQREGQDRHSIIADPLFVDSSDSDYRLRADSPARKAGVNVGLHYNRQGKTIVGQPDIGAY